MIIIRAQKDDPVESFYSDHYTKFKSVSTSRKHLTRVAERVKKLIGHKYEFVLVVAEEQGTAVLDVAFDD